jgi:hypothetical protein
MMNQVRLTRLALCSVLVLALSGCDTNVLKGAMSIRSVGSEIEVAVCEEAHVESVSADQRSWVWFGGWKNFWEGSGDLQLAEGDILTTRFLNDAIQGDFREPDLNGDFSILLQLADSSDLAAAFDSGPFGPPKDGWLQPDGKITSGPCE